jgi:DNA repair protein RadC
VRTTEQLRQAGELLDIELLDHIIIGRNRYISLKEQGLGF